MTLSGTELDAIQIPLLGNSAAVGVFSLLHIVLAALSAAFMLMAPLFEFRGRTNPFDGDLALCMTRFTVVVFSVSTVLAVIMVELMIGLFPLTTMWMWNHFRIPILCGVASFILMLLTLYPYYHFWVPLRKANATFHTILGALAAFFMLPWVLMLDGMGSYMLTPVPGGGMWERLHNPTWLPLAIHRMMANFMIAGYTLAAYGAWRAWKPGDHPFQSYYHHLMIKGWMIGLGAFLSQPFTGLVYALSIHGAAPGASEILLTGPYAPLLHAQVFFLSLLFLGNNRFLKSTRSPIEGKRWVDAGFLVLAALLLVTTSYPLFRRACLILLVGLTLWRLRTSVGKSPPTLTLLPLPMRTLALGMALISILLYLTMGTIREASRRPDTVRGYISLQDEPQLQARIEGALP